MAFLLLQTWASSCCLCLKPIVGWGHSRSWLCCYWWITENDRNSQPLALGITVTDWADQIWNCWRDHCPTYSASIPPTSHTWPQLRVSYQCFITMSRVPLGRQQNSASGRRFIFPSNNAFLPHSQTGNTLVSIPHWHLSRIWELHHNVSKCVVFTAIILPFFGST